MPILEAAEASRSPWHEREAVLGEQVRESVELLLRELNKAQRVKPDLLDCVRSDPRGGELSERRMLEALYQAAVRIIMRLVILFFAEARDLLPRSIPFYHVNYGLEGLYEQLGHAGLSEGSKEHESAWTRCAPLTCS